MLQMVRVVLLQLRPRILPSNLLLLLLLLLLLFLHLHLLRQVLLKRWLGTCLLLLLELLRLELLLLGW
jgi:hypothetical protein